MKAGPRDTLITIQRKSVTTDEFGGEIEAWNDLCREWVDYRPGSGTERRQAAQEGAALVATFRALASSNTRSVTPLDRLSFGGIWDITSSVRLGRDGIEITAVRAA